MSRAFVNYNKCHLTKVLHGHGEYSLRNLLFVSSSICRCVFYDVVGKYGIFLAEDDSHETCVFVNVGFTHID